MNTGFTNYETERARSPRFAADADEIAGLV